MLGVGSVEANLLYCIFQLIVQACNMSRSVTLNNHLYLQEHSVCVHITLQPLLDWQFLSFQSFCHQTLTPSKTKMLKWTIDLLNRFIVSLSWISWNDFNECCLLEMLPCFALSPQGVHSNKNIHQGEKAVCFLFIPKLKENWVWLGTVMQKQPAKQMWWRLPLW